MIELQQTHKANLEDPSKTPANSLRRGLLLNKFSRVLSRDVSNRAHLLVIEKDSVELVGIHQHLRTKGGGDELS